MQITPWHRYLYRVIVGSVLIIWGIAELLLVPSDGGTIPAILITAGLAFLLAGILRWRKYGNTPEKDERTRRIGVWGLSYSWILSLFFMTGLFLLNYLGMVSLTVQSALGTSVAVMTLSAVAFQVYLARKGDVE